MSRGSVNKVILIGTLGKDPDVKYAANGNAIANLSVATSEEWNDKNTGQKKEKTDWHSVAIFGKLAEIAGQYLTKGSKVYLEGKLQTRKWQDQSGQDRYTTEVVLSGFDGNMQMLGGGSNDSANQQGGFNQQPMQQQAMPQAGQQGGFNQQQPAPQNAPANPMAQPNVQPMGGQPAQQNAPAYAPNDFDDSDIPF